MKRVVTFILVAVILTGCKSDPVLSKAVSLRESVLAADGCSFHARITADYGDKLYIFGMQCRFDATGNLTFTVTEPDSIAGISGMIHDDRGKLTFDDQVLAFPLIADEQFSPVSAPWVFMKALRSGFIHSSAQIEGHTQICIDDSYHDDAMQVDIFLSASDLPRQAEILWKNRRILSLEITGFEFL